MKILAIVYLTYFVSCFNLSGALLLVHAGDPRGGGLVIGMTIGSLACQIAPWLP